ncbi:MAG: hypothetical protein KAS64_04560 [Spirochaetes bacterium]|nr:hypothetical protein [Spirochaetota bacterium]
MKLTVNGKRVMGSYGYRGGKINGIVTGTCLVFTWTEKNGRSKGKGYFILSDNAEKFQGKWGYKDSSLNGGKWWGKRILST